MKNSFSINFYKAYDLWKSTLKEDVKYQDYKKSLQNSTSGETFLSGSVGNKLLDLEWLEKIEEALPFMDKAIREARSFIEQRDEVVPIEKVKKVNTQSIRHLAQHTNMIARVENDEVTPDRILNIFYESNSAIYENRFLFTLLGRLNEFVQKRYDDLKNQESRIAIKYDINKTVRRKNKTAKMTLGFEFKTQEEEKQVDLKEDVENLSEFSRILRIRRIISDFYSLQLIKDLHGVELVKPPIIQTNLLAKNVNFRTCYELWDYIARYRQTGYEFENKEFTGKMPKKTDSDLSDVFVFTNFLTEMTFNTSLKRRLERDYKEQILKEKLAEKERKLLEAQKRKEELEEKIRVAIERKTTPLNKKIETLEERYQKLLFKYDSLQYKHTIMIDMANDVMKQHQLIEQEQNSIRDLKHAIMNMEEQIKSKNQAILEARHTLNQSVYPITEENAQARIQEQREEALKAKVRKYQEQKQQELKEAIKLFQAQKMKEFKDEVLNYQVQEQNGLKALPVFIHGLREDEIKVEPIHDEELEEQLQMLEEQAKLESISKKPAVYKQESIEPEEESNDFSKYELPEEKSEEEQELEELLKRLKELQG